MNSFTAIAIISAGIYSLALPARGDAVFYDEATLVKQAEAIAVVDLGTPRGNPPTGARSPGEMWRYTIVAPATTITVIQGTLPENFDFFGGEDFVCARCIPSKGRFLVFLRKDGEKWVGANWQFSLRPIKDGKIDWYEKGEQLKFSSQDEAEVIARVKGLIARKGD